MSQIQTEYENALGIARHTLDQFNAKPMGRRKRKRSQIPLTSLIAS